MATLEEYTQQLRQCNNGYESRQIIVNALKLINDNGADRHTLGNHELSYFALKSQLNAYLS